MTYYCVVVIETGEMTYCGRSELSAAAALLPGTCYGKAEIREEAKSRAQRWAAWFRAAPERLALARSVA